MKAITREWLNRAKDDLAAAQLLLSEETLTNVVAFHGQQAVEKALKAVIEELNLGLARTHSLLRLYEVVHPHVQISVDVEMLDRLEAVYIEARYPGEMGLLPYGKPTVAEAADFYQFARQVVEKVQAILDTPEE